MHLTGQQVVTLARNSFDACFATEQQRDRWKAELQAVAAQAAG
jgi:adenosine deaminase